MIKELLEASEIGINSFVDLERNIEQFAEEGLRTLVIAERRISADEYAVWADLYHAANTFVGRDYAEREAKVYCNRCIYMFVFTSFLSMILLLRSKSHRRVVFRNLHLIQVELNFYRRVLR